MVQAENGSSQLLRLVKKSTDALARVPVAGSVTICPENLQKTAVCNECAMIECFRGPPPPPPPPLVP